MQRLYSMFPAGGPGVGLLLLRFSLIASIIYQKNLFIAAIPNPFGFSLLFALFFCMALGLLTPLTVGLDIVFVCIFLCEDATLSPSWAVSTTLSAIAILLLGPGAYSVDAVLYGRRALLKPSK